MSYEVEHDVHINKTLCDVSPGALWLDAWIYITNNQLYNLKDNILQKVGVVLLKKLTEYIKPAIF